MKAPGNGANLADSRDRLTDHIGRVFIIAYRESTQLLETALTNEGFQCEVLRQEPREEEQEFSPSYLCLLNHQRAWKKALQDTQPTLIVEADFVPILGIGQLPLPFDPHQKDVGITWLYTCAPQVYSVSPEGYAEGFSTSMVAYIVTAQAASHLLDLVPEIQAKFGTAYSSWDSTIESFLRARNLKNYIPFRNYGEHGGRPNPEHYQNGLSRSHHADVLYGKLAFSPLYTTDKQDNPLKFLTVRLKARLKGMTRLVTGKFVRVKVLKHSSTPARILKFAIGRQLSTRL